MTALVTIDLSPDTRDFQRVALEPGLPMLDANSNAGAVLQRWLGDFAAEAEWLGDRAEFYALKDGRRQLDAVAEPVTEKDLKGALRSQFEALQQRIQAISPQSSSEQLIAKQVLTEDPAPQTQLVKYRVAGGAWQLVLLWGFERKDTEPATPAICRKCESGPWLYLKRKVTASQCPGCANKSGGNPVAANSRSRWPAIAAVVVLLAAALGGWAWWNRGNEQALVDPPQSSDSTQPTEIASGLQIEPQDWTAPVGAAQAFRVLLASQDGNEPSDVTRLVHVTSSDPRVCRFDRLQTLAQARSTGTATLDFRYGEHSRRVNVRVDPPTLPQSIRIEPSDDAIHRGETRRLRVLGSYEDGSEVDLTEATTWESTEPTTLFCFNGLIEGISPGTSDLTVRYAAEPDGVVVETRQTLKVLDANYQSLAIRFEPEPLSVHDTVQFIVEATTIDGEQVPVSESSQLAIEVQPSTMVDQEGSKLRGLAAGTVTVSAMLGELSASAELTIASAASGEQPGLPERIEMLVGESLDPAEQFEVDLDRLTVDESGVLELDSRGRLLARKPGTTKVEITHHGKTQTVKVDVAEEPFESLQIVPAELQVPLHSEVAFRVTGVTQAGQQVDLAADLLQWEILPTEHVQLDPKALIIRGLAISDARQPMLCRFQELDAAGYVTVTPRAFELVTQPSGEVDLPVGSELSPKAIAVYGPEERVELPEDQVVWTVESESDGLELQNNTIVAKAISEQPLRLRVEYAGPQSRELTAALTVRSTATTDETLRLDVGQEVLFPGDEGTLGLTSEASSAGEPSVAPASFQSSDPQVFQIGDAGKWRAIKPGVVDVTVAHPSLAEPLTQSIAVSQPESTGLMFHPDVLAVGVGQAARLELFVVSGYDQDAEPILQPVTQLSEVRFAVADDSVTLRPRWVIGESATSATEITAEYNGMTASLLVEVREVPAYTPLRIVPESITAAVGGSFRPTLEQQLPEPTALAAGSEANNVSSARPEASAYRSQWRRIDAREATWTSDEGIAISTPAASAPPVVTIQTATPQTRQLTARIGETTATATIQISDPAPLDESAQIVLLRFPEGEHVAVGQSQRYGFEIHTADGTRAATDVQWQAPLENSHLRFQDGQLTALAAGKTQPLEAVVDGQTFRWQTTTVATAPELGQELAERNEQPIALRLVAQDGDRVRLIVDGMSDAFRVEAEYADGLTRNVTSRAEWRVASEDASTIAIDQQRLVGIAPGTVSLSARFAGVDTETPLPVEVLLGEQVDQIQVTPDASTLKLGETATLKAIALSDGQAIGDVTQHPDIVWKSRSPEVLSVIGSRVSALAAGKGGVTAQMGETVSNVSEFSVSDSAQAGELDAIKFVPSRLAIRVGERKRLGRDVTLRRGQATLQVADWKLLDTDVAKLEGDWLIGMKPGSGKLQATSGDGTHTLPIRVLPPTRTRMTAPRDRIARRGVSRQGPNAQRSAPGRGQSPAPPRSNDRQPTALAAGRGENGSPADNGNARRMSGANDARNQRRAPDAVYDFSTHKAEGTESQLMIEPSGGRLPVGGVASIRVWELDASGNRTDRTAAARLDSNNDAVLRVAGKQVACRSAGRASLRATLPESALMATAVFEVSETQANSLEVVPAQVVLTVGEQQQLTVRADGIQLADRRRLSYQMSEGDDVARVDDSGLVTGQSPGRATVRVTWDGRQGIFVPVTVRPRQLFSQTTRRDQPPPQTAPASQVTSAPPQASSAKLQFDIVDVQDEQDYSTADIRILVPREWGDFEFRVADSEQPGPWVTTRDDGERRIALLKSPPLIRRTNKLHRVLLEARTPGAEQVERYALRFELKTVAGQQEVDEPNE